MTDHTLKEIRTNVGAYSECYQITFYFKGAGGELDYGYTINLDLKGSMMRTAVNLLDAANHLQQKHFNEG